MWYNTIPTISATAWLFQVVDLLDHTLRAVLGQPVLAAFAGAAVVIIIFCLFQRARKAAK